MIFFLIKRPGIVKALDEFKLSIYGDNYEENTDLAGKKGEASKKRKSVSDTATKQYANYDWSELADNGKVK